MQRCLRCSKSQSSILLSLAERKAANQQVGCVCMGLISQRTRNKIYPSRAASLFSAQYFHIVHFFISLASLPFSEYSRQTIIPQIPAQFCKLHWRIKRINAGTARRININPAACLFGTYRIFGNSLLSAAASIYSRRAQFLRQPFSARLILLILTAASGVLINTRHSLINEPCALEFHPRAAE